MASRDFDVEYTKAGAIYDSAQVGSLLKACCSASSLLVLTHGWNNDEAEAQRLYDNFLASLHLLNQSPARSESQMRVMRVLWPSKKFALEHLIPGGGMASAIVEDDRALHESLRILKHDPDRLGEDSEPSIKSVNIDHAIAMIERLEDSEAARREFVLRIRAVLNPDEAHNDDASREFFELEPDVLFESFAPEIPLEVPVGEGGAATVSDRGAAFLGDMVSGVKSAARRIANYATYYQMKSRAGAVGRGGLAATLNRLRDQRPDLPIHLVGHSFGARVVVSAAARLEPSPGPVSMCLLQAAFSHNGFAEKFDGKTDGAFRSVLTEHRVSGPIVITHTKRDLAVGIAYPLASRIARDNSAAVGDQNDPYGGMGRNGAQHTPEVSQDETVLRSWQADGSYHFSPGHIFNLRADEFIADHNDVTGENVVNATLHAMRAA